VYTKFQCGQSVFIKVEGYAVADERLNLSLNNVEKKFSRRSLFTLSYLKDF